MSSGASSRFKVKTDYRTSLEKVILPEDFETNMKLYDSGEWSRDGIIVYANEVKMLRSYIPLFFGCRDLEINGVMYQAE